MLRKFGLYFLMIALLVGCKDNRSNSPDEQPEQTTIVQVVEPIKFKSLLESTPSPQLVDVRTANEVADGVVSGAKHICFTCPEFEEKIDMLDKERPVFLYCKVGGRSSRAAAILKRKGFNRIYDLKGGTEAWLDNGYELDLYRRSVE